jgi:hypothetical protein
VPESLAGFTPDRTRIGVGATCKFGAIASTRASIINSTHATCRVPALAVGNTDVRLAVNGDGATASALAFSAIGVKVLAVKPNVGPIAGASCCPGSHSVSMHPSLTDLYLSFYLSASVSI